MAESHGKIVQSKIGFEKVDLFIAASGLPNMETISTNTDAFAVLFTKKAPDCKELVQLAITEVVKDSQNPQWVSPITVDYVFEAVQEMVIQVFHQKNKEDPANLSRHMLVGQIDFKLSALMHTRGSEIESKIYLGRNQGNVRVRAEARTDTRENFCVTFLGAKFVNKAGLFGKSDPFLEISRMNEDGKYNIVWRNAHIDNNLSPKWPRAVIPMATLCNGDLDRPLKIEVWDFISSGNHTFMGQVETSVRAMLTGGGEPMNLSDPKKPGKVLGTLAPWNAEIEKHYTLTDFISGGCEISLIVGVDFTASNGDPTDPSSLHHSSKYSGTLNEYQQAILSVGDVLQSYDSDNKYHVFGFGAKIRQANGVLSPAQHCFPIYGGDGLVTGVEGIMKAYEDGLDNVTLSGPTLFGPLIRVASDIAQGYQCSQEKQTYTILLILTDGAINDMPETIKAIIAASYQPMSIIIVGVGSADFSSMVQLDADEGGMLRTHDERACRDIVQFVSFLEVMAHGKGNLAKEVLQEIPDQLLLFMEQKGFHPNHGERTG